MAKLSYGARKRISASGFAFPAQRKEPLDNASHVRNAAARLNQVKGVSPTQRKAAAGKIVSAEHKFGIEPGTKTRVRAGFSRPKAVRRMT